ncbi:MAG TPA: glycosyltransferase family A protein, partial [Acidimicrobiales bacterium]|nr:glycosyltransferase family A protein [Acidimicrobiales bacterium]
AVVSALSQQPPPLEVIVVDDHSDDDSVDVANSISGRIRVISTQVAGAAAARNAGVQAAGGALVAFLDADDRWAPGALANLHEALLSAPGAAIAYGRVQEFCSPDVPVEVSNRLQPRPGALRGFIAGTFVFRASVFHQVGPLDPGLRAGEVADWLSRVRNLGLTEASTDEVVLERRVHAGHLAAEKRAARADLLKVVRSALARQRAQKASG